MQGPCCAACVEKWTRCDQNNNSFSGVNQISEILSEAADRRNKQMVSTTTIIDKFLDIFELDTFVIVVPEDNVGDACLADNNPNKSAREY